jgi:hypothetical protein
MQSTSAPDGDRDDMVTTMSVRQLNRPLCACHNPGFDPISRREYYRLRQFCGVDRADRPYDRDQPYMCGGGRCSEKRTLDERRGKIEKGECADPELRHLDARIQKLAGPRRLSLHLGSRARASDTKARSSPAENRNGFRPISARRFRSIRLPGSVLHASCRRISSPFRVDLSTIPYS